MNIKNKLNKEIEIFENNLLKENIKEYVSASILMEIVARLVSIGEDGKKDYTKFDNMLDGVKNFIEMVPELPDSDLISAIQDVLDTTRDKTMGDIASLKILTWVKELLEEKEKKNEKK